MEDVKGQWPDRRRAANVRLTEAVDSLIYRFRSLDFVHAQHAFLANRIPATVAARVLFHVNQRRSSQIASHESVEQ